VSSPAWRATYRVQLRGGVDFAAVEAAVPYLAELGVSHVYLSPIFTATPGSTHGYDAVDPNEIDPDLGGRPGFEALVGTARDAGLGILLDIVPNHLAAHEANPWWWELLRDGRDAPAARIFDIAWEEVDGRLPLPVLGDAPDQELRRGTLRVDRSGPEPVLRYHDRRFPVAPGTDQGSTAEVLARQHYELLQWRTGLERLAYRRFFDITDLIGVRVEDEEVFAASHALILELVDAGLVDGLRVDHVDGLADPGRYLELLAARAPIPIVVEKILSAGEQLPESWPVAGTTGYEVLADLLLLHVDGAGVRELDREYRCRDGGAVFTDVEHAAKREVLERFFSRELHRAARRLVESGGGDAATVPAAERLVQRLSVELEVYRTYVDAAGVSSDDRERLERVLGVVAVDLDDEAAALLPALRRALARPADDATARFVTAWQQLSGPTMAKGHEDTALYRHTRLLATNEVGVDPDVALAGDPVAAFHEHSRRRGAAQPGTLAATATHDTKRGEDTRLRIALLSEAPGEWRLGFDRWRDVVRNRLESRTSPPTIDELRLVAQTVLGSWPVNAAGWTEYADRVVDTVRKSAREAKQSTSWLDPDEEHEAGLEHLVRTALADDGTTFVDAFGDLLRRMGPAGAAASLSQVVLKVAGPGVPDFYRGCEHWDLSLVDPDNRRPVDIDARQRELAELRARPVDPGALLRAWPDGRVKQWVTHRALGARARDPELFGRGDYEPLTPRGPRRDHVVAFARRLGSRHGVVLAARRCLALGPGLIDTPAEIWRGSTVDGPETDVGWVDVLTGRNHPGGALDLAAVLSSLPVALLVRALDEDRSGG
jgi:(1->4)-alpha-D-glucan 1-alpha-D-glucosylmutase